MYAIDHGIRHNIQYTKDTGIKMINNFSFVKKYLLRTNIPVKIYNASSGGMLDVFPRKNLKHILYEEK